MSVTTSSIQLPSDGGGKHTATVTKSEDTATKHLSRVVIENADGANTYSLAIDSAGKIGINNASIPVTDNGGSLTVDVGTALPAGSNAIGKLAANDGVDIGDVTINNASIAVTGTFWQATQPVSLASVPSHAVTNAGTFRTQETGAALTALQLLDDVVATAGSGALTKGNQIAGTDGATARILSVNASGHVNIADGGNSITVDGSVAVGTALPAGDNNIGNVDVVTLPALVAGSAIIGKVGIDQTTPGTTNKVSIGTDGTVAINAAVPAGDNVVGRVKISDGTEVANVNASNQLEVAVMSTANDIVARTFVTKTVDFTASQTGQTIWTPTSSKKFVITDIILSFSAAGAITIFDGTDSTTYRVAKVNGAVNGGMVSNYAKPYVSAAANNVLKYTTGTGAAGSLTVNGYEV